MMHYNCYFCGKVCQPEKPDPRGMPTGRYVCTKHPMQIWHTYSRIPEERDGWSFIYFPVEINNRTYGFGFYPKANALRIARYDKNKDGNYERKVEPEINIKHIPQNLTPENAKEKLPFYLTFW